jgi:uncharacterized membrane protein YidH (DUF202 family)
MSAFVANPASVFAQRVRAARGALRPALYRSVLLLGGTAVLALVAWWLPSEAASFPDPDLARLLRGMALIKAGIALAALGAVSWRFGWPIQRGFAAAYMVGCWVLAGASLMVWQLTMVPAAAIGFHGFELGLLFVAWRDHRAERADAAT